MQMNSNYMPNNGIKRERFSENQKANFLKTGELAMTSGVGKIL